MRKPTSAGEELHSRADETQMEDPSAIATLLGKTSESPVTKRAARMASMSCTDGLHETANVL
jgi:hypothetical protein